MPELKRFLTPLSPYQRLLYTVMIALSAVFLLFFVYLVVIGMMPLVMLSMPLIMFGGFCALMCWLLVRSMHAFDNWWNAFTDAERAEIEHDFRQGVQNSHHLITGERYAYFRNTGRTVPYEKIGVIDFRRGKNWHCYVHIHVKDAKMVFLDLPSFSDAEKLRDELLSHRVFTDGTE